MAKFNGAIGYARLIETAPGVFQDVIEERNYRGDFVLNQIRFQPSEQANDNLNVDSKISILADSYARVNVGHMKYVVLDNVAWKIQSFNVVRPRIILQIGGVYNGKRPS